jgi:molecular chaperone DnaK
VFAQHAEAQEALRDVMDSGDADVIKAKTDALMQSSMKVGEALYKAQQDSEAAGGDAGAAGADAGAGAAGDETVVDADFEEVDDKKGK